MLVAGQGWGTRPWCRRGRSPSMPFSIWNSTSRSNARFVDGAVFKWRDDAPCRCSLEHGSQVLGRTLKRVKSPMWPSKTKSAGPVRVTFSKDAFGPFRTKPSTWSRSPRTRTRDRRWAMPPPCFSMKNEPRRRRRRCPQARVSASTPRSKVRLPTMVCLGLQDLDEIHIRPLGSEKPAWYGVIAAPEFREHWRCFRCLQPG